METRNQESTFFRELSAILILGFWFRGCTRNLYGVHRHTADIFSKYIWDNIPSTILGWLFQFCPDNFLVIF